MTTIYHQTATIRQQLSNHPLATIQPSISKRQSSTSAQPRSSQQHIWHYIPWLIEMASVFAIMGRIELTKEVFAKFAPNTSGELVTHHAPAHHCHLHSVGMSVFDLVNAALCAEVAVLLCTGVMAMQQVRAACYVVQSALLCSAMLCIASEDAAVCAATEVCLVPLKPPI